MADYCGTGSGNFPKPGDPDLNNSLISASPAFGGIDVTWTYPELNAHAVAHSRLYRSGSADPETRVLLRKVNGDFFYDKTESATPIQYYYWVQHVSVNGTVGELLGPASATARPTIEQMILMLSGEINDGLLATALRNRIDEIDTNKDEILAERLDRVNSDDMFASALAGMEQVVADVDTLIRQEVTERTEGDSSIVESLNLLFAQQQDNNALILEEQTVRATADDALASDISTLQAETDTNAAAITSESTTRATADEALGERIDTVIATSVRIFRADTAPTPGTTPINLNDLWFDTSDGNRLYQWTGLEWVDTQDTGIQAAFAAINSEEQARTTADSALSSRLDTLSASVQDNAADVQTEQKARADADSALASRITTVEASSADNAAAITSESQARADADEALSQQVQTLVASTSQIFRSDVPPDPAVRIVNENDLWVNTAEDNRLYQWDGTNWVNAQDGGIGAAFAAIEDERKARTNADGAMAQSITTLEASVGRKTRTYFQANPPALPENIGDLWLDTDDNNKLYVWQGETTGWVLGTDQRISQLASDLVTAQQAANDAMSAAEAAQAVADNAIRTYYQATAPTGLNNTTDLGDLWFDTDNDQAYRWNGTNWKLIQDNSIAMAIAAAEDAQATADGKITTYYQATAPTAEGVGDLWIDTDSGNTLYLWNGASWALASDQNKTRISRQPSAPTEAKVGDLWLDEGDGDKPYQWDGATWQPINLYTGNQVSAAIQDFKQAQIGYCLINGAPDGSKTTKDSCEAAAGTWLDMHAIAEVVKGVQITDGDNETANVEQRMRAYKDDIGNLNSQYTVKVQSDSNGTKYVGGFGLATQGQSVEAGFDVDRFWVGKLQPDGSIDGGKLPLIIEGSEVFIDQAAINELTFSKLRDESGSVVVNNGKLKADYIDVDNLVARQAESDNFVAGQSGWKLGADGTIEANNGTFRGHVEMDTGYIADSVQIGGVPKYQNYKSGNFIRSGATTTSSATITNAAYISDGVRAISSDYWSIPGGVQYLQADLGSERYVSENRMFFYALDGRRYKYAIAVSTDGNTWEYVVGSGPTNGGNATGFVWSRSAAGGYEVGYEFPTITPIGKFARYVRVWMNGNSVNTGNHGYEWELYGSGGGGDDPYVASIGSSSRASSALTDYWVKPGFTWIDGTKIYTGDAYVDTLQIRGNAVTLLQAQTDGSRGGATSWVDVISFTYYTETTGNIDALVTWGGEVQGGTNGEADGNGYLRLVVAGVVRGSGSRLGTGYITAGASTKLSFPNTGVSIKVQYRGSAGGAACRNVFATVLGVKR
ncbi:DUF1983 domain-containing protein [uncultured Marinobacter sp.]|uniref:phage tail tip fiber protein n=1 Tax=uncultured Marinobacter sp. TaxID=187379 RepID=UPI0025973DAE|nr:DUF1983 domain-containing protein [uncultured Marinobacter sp.]